MSDTVIKPRNTHVLVRIVDVQKINSNSQIIAPQSSQLGKEYIVEAVGPKVTGLDIGDKVLILGQRGVNWDFLPNTKELLCCDESLIALRFVPKECDHDYLSTGESGPCEQLSCTKCGKFRE